MPAVLTHQAIMLLARERVADIRDRLLLKKGLNGPLTDLELRVLRLATLTHIMLSDSDDSRLPIETPNDLDWPDGFGKGVSRFAVMGSMGPDIPGLAALLAPAQAVWFDIVHKGTPDAHREQVDARTTDVALALWKGASQALSNRPTGGVPAAKALDRARNQIRAYVLGHLTHLAGDMLAHPFINDVEWHVPRRQPPSNPFSFETFKFSHERTEGSLDSRVAIEMFGRDGPRSGQAWSAWWPTVDEVPPELFIGYERALEEVHKSKIDRPDGLAAFEKALEAFSPPVPDADFFRDGYQSLSNAGVGILYHWGYGAWLGFLSIAVVPLLATFPLAFALPRGKEVFTKSLADAGERAAFEALALPLVLNGLLPVVYGGVIAGLTWRGAESIVTVGLIGTAIGALTAFIFLITLLAGDPGAGYRWAFLFAIPAAIGLALSGAALGKSVQHEKRRAKLLLLFAAPFLIMLVADLLLMVFSELIGMGSEQGGAISWAVLSGLIVVAGLLVLFLWLPFKARDARVPEDAPAFPAQRPHHVRLFDKSSLFERPNQLDATLTETHYPSGSRPLLRLWWTGEGDFFIRARRTHLEYEIFPAGANVQVFGGPDILNSPGLAIHTVAEQFACATFSYRIAGEIRVKAATGGLTFSAAHVVTANAFGVILVQIDVAGDITTKVPSTVQAHASAADALAALPAPDDGKLTIGHILIANNAGDWTANTDDMTNGGDVLTATFSNRLQRMVPAPITPMTQQQLAEYLTNAVRDNANRPGLLKCALVHESEANVEIPPGATFADHGDVAESAHDDSPESALSKEASEFKKLSRDNDDESYVLYHSPKRAQAVRFDRFGPVPFDDREIQLVNGGGTISGSGTTITGVATSFRFFFQPGDRIVFNGQARVVTKVTSDLGLVISSRFNPAPDREPYQRLESAQEVERGYAFVAKPRPRSGVGNTIMDFAGDLGALFCLGGASRMLDGIEAHIPDLNGMVDGAGNAVPFPDLGPVARVFRNWSLDRRLVDEWREAVLGGATSDDGSGLEPGLPVLLQQGWIPTLRKWLRVVDARTQSAIDGTQHDAGPNEPSNLELSQAMARLLDMPQPILVTRAP